MKRTLLGGIVVAALLAGFGCSGGGGGATTPAAPVVPAPSKAPQASAVFKIRIALPPTGASSKRPAYVSPATRSIGFTINATTQVVQLSPDLPNCPIDGSGTSYTCTATFEAPVGDDHVDVKTYASTDGSGNSLSQETMDVTVIGGQDNNFNLTLNGVASSFFLTVTPSSTVNAGTPGSLTVDLGGKDDAGYTIIGTLVNAAGQLLRTDGGDIVPTLVSSDATHLAVSNTGSNEWTVAYDGFDDSPSQTLTASIAGYTPDTTTTITVVAATPTPTPTPTPTATPTPTPSPSPTPVEAITNSTFTSAAFDGTAGWFRCVASRVTTSGLTPVNASPAPVNQLAVVAGATAAPTGATADVSQQTTTPSGAAPPSGSAHIALVGYSGGSGLPAPGTNKPNKGNTGICQVVTVPATSPHLTFNWYEGGDDNWSKSDSEVDVYASNAFTGTNPGIGPTTAPTARLIAENNCYDSAGYEAIFLPSPWGTGTVAISSTARWSGCPQTPGGADPGAYTPSSGGGVWYARSIDMSAYAGQTVTLFIGISRDAGGATPTGSGAQYYNYVFVDNVHLTGTGT